MKELRSLGLLALGGCLAFAVSVQRDPERFRIRHDIPSKGVSWDPNPKWTNVPWEPSADAPYVTIRREATAAIEATRNEANAKAWMDRLERAYQDWYGDHQNPVKLFRVSAFVAVVRTISPALAKGKRFSEIDSNANLGWSFLRESPPSYEFCRRAYLHNAGDEHFHNLGDLALRLLARDPMDRTVIAQMVFEYQWKKPVEAFERCMFSAFERLKKSNMMRPIDFYHLGLAYRLYGLKHSSKKQYGYALLNIDKSIQLHGKDVPAWLVKFRKDTIKERDELQPRGNNWKWNEDGR